MKKSLLTLIIIMCFSAIGFSQDKRVEILHAVEDVTGEDYYYIPYQLTFIEGNSGFRLWVSANKGKYSGIIISCKNIGTCHEGDKLYFLFTDNTRHQIEVWNEFNCEGSAYFDLYGNSLKKLQKPIKSIKFENGMSHESMTVDVKPDDANFFININDAFQNNRFVRAHFIGNDIVKY